MPDPSPPGPSRSRRTSGRARGRPQRAAEESRQRSLPRTDTQPPQSGAPPLARPLADQVKDVLLKELGTSSKPRNPSGAVAAGSNPFRTGSPGVNLVVR